MMRNTALDFITQKLLEWMGKNENTPNYEPRREEMLRTLAEYVRAFEYKDLSEKDLQQGRLRCLMPTEAMTLVECRPEIREFAIALENFIRHSGNLDSVRWRTMAYSHFVRDMIEEVYELDEGVQDWIEIAYKDTEIENYPEEVKAKEKELFERALKTGSLAMFLALRAKRGKFTPDILRGMVGIHFIKDE